MPAPQRPSTPSGRFVRNLRLNRGETQTEFARALGVTQGTVSRVELGDRPFTDGFAFRLVSRIGADVDEVARYVPIPGYLAWITLGLAGGTNLSLTQRTSGLAESGSKDPSRAPALVGPYGYSPVSADAGPRGGEDKRAVR